MPYPDTLPMPQTSTVTKGERRALSNEQQPREALPLQLDGMEFEELSWPPLDSSQMATLLGWWRTELLYGGAWFVATWPLPRGVVEAVRKFVSPLRREFVPAANGGRWRVTATCEVRGEGLFPLEPSTGSDIGWMNPISNADDPSTASIDNSGAPQDEGDPFGFTAYGALAPWVSSGETVEWSLDWAQVGEGGAPTLTPEAITYGTFQIDFHNKEGPGTNLTVGIATITATVGGVPCIGYLTFTCADPTEGGYGRISWEHHAGTPP